MARGRRAAAARRPAPAVRGASAAARAEVEAAPAGAGQEARRAEFLALWRHVRPVTGDVVALLPDWAVLDALRGLWPSVVQLSPLTGAHCAARPGLVVGCCPCGVSPWRVADAALKIARPTDANVVVSAPLAELTRGGEVLRDHVPDVYLPPGGEGCWLVWGPRFRGRVHVLDVLAGGQAEGGHPRPPVEVGA